MAAPRVMVNLLPAELQAGRPSAFRQPGRVVGFLFLAGILVIYAGFLMAGRSAAEDLRALQEELAFYLPRTEEARALEERINTLRRQKAEMEAFAQAGRKWSQFLEDLGAALPDRVWMVQLEATPSGEVLLTGRTTSLAAVGEFLTALERLPYWHQVELQAVQAVAGHEGLLEFKIKAALADYEPG